jgi:hypothetical protein
LGWISNIRVHRRTDTVKSKRDPIKTGRILKEAHLELAGIMDSSSKSSTVHKLAFAAKKKLDALRFELDERFLAENRLVDGKDSPYYAKPE